MVTAPRVGREDSMASDLRRALETLQRFENRGVDSRGFKLIRSISGDLLVARLCGMILQSQRYGGGLDVYGQVADAMEGKFFGYEQWEAFFSLRPGESESHPIPWSMEELAEPCPFTPGRTIAETHFLWWFPIEANGNPLNGNIFEGMLNPYSMGLFADGSGGQFARIALENQPMLGAYGGEDRWNLTFIGPVPSSIGITGSDQGEVNAQIGSGYFWNDVATEITARTLYRLLLGKSYGDKSKMWLAHCSPGQPMAERGSLLEQDLFGAFWLSPAPCWEALSLKAGYSIAVGASRRPPDLPF